MEFRHFRDLEKLDQTGSFSQAATLSNLSQPAFSRRIRALEMWVGTDLVDRSRQPVKLTNAGRAMLEAGLQAIERVERERKHIQDIVHQPDRYLVTFGAQHSISWRFYPAWLQSIEEAYGPILSRLRADDLPNCLMALEAGEVDFVMAYAPVGDAGTVTRNAIRVGTDQLIPVCKADETGGPIFAFGDGDHRLPYLQFGDTAPIGDLLSPMLGRFGLRARLRTVYENAMAGALRMKARAGDGVAWLPRSLVEPDLDAGHLAITGDPDWIVKVDIRLFRNPKVTNPVTRSLWSLLEARQPTG